MTIRAELYPYQRSAFERFLERGNLLLAFDVGLGKTITSIAIAEELLELREVHRVLLVVPASLKLQWARALAKFTDLPSTTMVVKDETIVVPDHSVCVIVDGSPEHRERLYLRARDSSIEYVIVGYEQVVSDFRRIKQLGCDLVVLDEASAIKTPGTKRTGAVKRHLKAPYRLALTATPIENRPEEVFSLMSWVDEAVLGRHDLFDKSYIDRNPWGAVAGYRHLDVLHEKLAPAMVRKTRHDPEVREYMPDVEHEVWRVDMDPDTRAAYKDMAGDLLLAYDSVNVSGGSFNVDSHYGMGMPGHDKRGDKSALGRLMSVHGCMEMLLAHPSLLARSANLYLTTNDQGSKYAADMMLTAREVPGTQPKLDYLIRAVGKILAEDPTAKVLVFSFYKGMLPLMAGRFGRGGHESVRYDGDMSTREKEAAVQKFKSDPGTRLFLSSHAGAYGTDLPEASWLINYDIPWGSGKATQINGRHVRASSEFDVVHVVDMVVDDSVETRKIATKNGKGNLSDSVVDGHGRAEIKGDIESLKKHAESVVGPGEEVLIQELTEDPYKG